MFKLKKLFSLHTCLVIFGDGTSEFKEAATRLGNQAKSLGVFSEVIVLNSFLLSEFSDLYKQDFDKISTLTDYPLYFRAIKPWAILACMQDARNKFDLIFYIDAGCEMPNNIISRMKLRLLLMKAYCYGSIAERTGYKETTYTRRNLIEHFSLPAKLILSGQVQSTWSIFRNSKKNKEFMLEWIKLSEPKYNFWQNPKVEDLGNEFSDFIENRWDQSIFSMLYKRNHFKTKKIYWEYAGRFGSLRGLSIPIHATRNRTGNSFLPKFHENNLIAIISIALNILADFLRVAKLTAHKVKFLILHRSI